MTKRLPRTVSKEQLTTELGISTPTLNKWIQNNPDFPIYQVGEKGRAWLFDPDKVKAWRKSQVGDRTERIREAQSPNLRKLQAQAELVEPQLAERQGELVRVTELRETLQGALSGLARALDTIPHRLRTERSIPDETCRAVADFLYQARRELVTA